MHIKFLREYYMKYIINHIHLMKDLIYNKQIKNIVIKKLN